MPPARSLSEYGRKRDFKKTAEPRKGGRAGGSLFVIQKHAATALHYDFRLEAEGVLLSWAVPKGPSTDPSDKRLAMRVEDHPLSYADFEGVIPKGEYGGGQVIVWDIGTYENLKEDVPVVDQLDKGHLTVWLEGRKIQGGYSLRRWGKDKRGREKWLLVKMDDEMADRRRKPTSTQPESVLTGRTIEDLKKDG
jgi:DNA ligase D-like protein (predicted 3'-phosphoesterase)